MLWLLRGYFSTCLDLAIMVVLCIKLIHFLYHGAFSCLCTGRSIELAFINGDNRSPSNVSQVPDLNYELNSLYRVSHLLVNMDWVDLRRSRMFHFPARAEDNYGSGSPAAMGTPLIQVNPTQGREEMRYPVHSQRNHTFKMQSMHAHNFE